MIRPMTPDTWRRSLDLPARLFGEGGVDGTDYELYEEEDEFHLAVELPGFEPDEITPTWDDGVLNVVAEHVDEARDRQRSYSRRFRFPKEVEEDAIAAEYRNGVLEVRLPISDRPHLQGREIPIEG